MNVQLNLWTQTHTYTETCIRIEKETLPQYVWNKTFSRSSRVPHQTGKVDLHTQGEELETLRLYAVHIVSMFLFKLNLFMV